MWQPKFWKVMAISAVTVSGLTLAAYSAATTQPSDGPPPAARSEANHGGAWHHGDRGGAWGTWGARDHRRGEMHRGGGQWGEHGMAKCAGQCEDRGAMMRHGMDRPGMRGMAMARMMGPGSTMRTLMSALLGEHGMMQGKRMGKMGHGSMGHRMMQGRMMGDHRMGPGMMDRHAPKDKQAGKGHAGWSHHRDGGEHGMGDPAVRRMMMGQIGRALVLRSQLDLTKDQQSKVREIVKENHASVVRAMRVVMERQIELQKLAMTGADKKAIEKAASELGKAAARAAKTQSSVAKKIRGVLTDDQAAAVDTFVNGSAKAKVDFMKHMAERYEKKAAGKSGHEKAKSQ